MVDRYYAAFDERPALAVKTYAPFAKDTVVGTVEARATREGTGEDLIPIYDRRAVGSCEPVAFAFGTARAHALADLMNERLPDAP